MAELVREKNASDSVETPNEEETCGRITERKKDTSKRDKARSKSRPPKSLNDEGASGDSLEEHVAVIETYVIELKEQMDSLQEAVNMMSQENVEVIEAAKALVRNMGQDFKKEIEKMTHDLLSARKFLEDEIFTMHEKIDNAIKECQNHQKKNNDGSTSSSQGTPFSPLKVPKPDMYNGTRNATLVENFLFGLEQYFKAMGVVEDAVRITNAPAFFYSEAKAKLRRLRHTGTITDYIKEFTTILLEIVDVPDQDALFYFKDGLKEWARIEIDRRNVKTLDEAIAAAESIVDYSNRPRRPLIDQEGVKRASPKRLDDRRDEGPKFEKSFQNKDMSKPPPKPCFICDGSHWTRDCPSRKAINALVAEMGSITEELGSIRRLGTIKEILARAKTKDQGLLFTELKVNDMKTLGLIDTGATDNFLDVKEAECLGIKYTPEKGKIKAVNSKPQQILGTAKVKVHIDKWANELTFTVVPMDDYRIILGLDFFERARAFPMPATKTLVIHDNGLSQVTNLKKQSEIQPLLSAMEFKRTAKERECFLAGVRKCFIDETTLRAPRLFEKRKEWHKEKDETRARLKNAVRQVKKCVEKKKMGDPHHKEFLIKWKESPEEKPSWKRENLL
ncbi:hypothetical protein CTI12_AA219830 [Artemisia annua]|uniref:Retrotransposon gag domain-containing protein n=1 Tax=Artemisia annua TaxID=35608 RepID=A0A2U1NWJ0_ARTAN|nr:hypothetical protein CTI12_AA219830 [Artemisia annua]